ncbi:HD domain-containing protein [Limisalsivibrio acetivorans]|uniref:HD domain-containing protein n=1 Tax=Limisalsivibrio acetivorans TaxID=1304888 RepID=UPI0003B6F776|nr:HD domain-containing protein [Limisalsivibrio acetivorans]
MSFSEYLVSVRKLNNIGRWASDFMHRRASVAEHSFSVAHISQMLGVIEENHGNRVDWSSLYRKALNHDVVEAFTGDILSHVKHRTETMKSMVNNIELLIAEDMLFSSMEEPYRSRLKDFMFDGKDKTLEGQILRYADNIDALLECLNESRLGNKIPFEDKYHEILEKLKNSELHSVAYFVKNILPDLEKGTE